MVGWRTEERDEEMEMELEEIGWRMEEREGGDEEGKREVRKRKRGRKRHKGETRRKRDNTERRTGRNTMEMLLSKKKTHHFVGVHKRQLVICTLTSDKVLKCICELVPWVTNIGCLQRTI